MIMRPLSISELENETGVGRSTIHHYIRVGLLPPAQKASPTRAVYDESHAELLKEITRMKREGLRLKQIEEELSPRIEAAVERGVDLVAQQNEDARNAILEAAARRFAELGYEQTRISDICKGLGVTAPLLYSHFPSKRHLFIACFQVYYNWIHAELEQHIRETQDTAARGVWRIWAGYARQAYSPDLQALARVEAFHPESELRPLVRKTYEKMLADPITELAAQRKPGANPGLFDDELAVYALLGALENMQMRASWDNRYSTEDVMRNRTAIFMCIRAAYSGRVDLTEEWKEVEPLVKQLAGKVRLPKRG
jgi:AcrR family transcriptional regulator/predicted DNA-binding transcriptional regulator AlpA